MADIQNLTNRVVSHLAQREVLIRWENPPSASAAGQTIKTQAGSLVIYIASLDDIDTRFKVLLHELAHARLDAGWIPRSNDARKPAWSIKRSKEERTAWRVHPREQRASRLADQWVKHANKNKHEYWRVGRSEMECKLLSLLDWRG